jgi:hypothetical protein
MDCFAKIPIDRDSSVFKEPIYKTFSSPWGGDEFGEHRRTDCKISALEGGFKGGSSGRSCTEIGVPQCDNDIRIDRGGHWIKWISQYGRAFHAAIDLCPSCQMEFRGCLSRCISQKRFVFGRA